MIPSIPWELLDAGAATAKGFSYADILSTVLDALAVPKDKHGAVVGAIKRFQTLGLFPAVGKGTRRVYSFHDAAVLALSLRLRALGLDPTEIMKLVTADKVSDGVFDAIQGHDICIQFSRDFYGSWSIEVHKGIGKMRLSDCIFLAISPMAYSIGKELYPYEWSRVSFPDDEDKKSEGVINSFLFDGKP